MLTEYNEIKNLNIWYDPLLGEINLDFILTILQECVNRQKEFEDIVYNILKNLNYDDENLVSLFNLSQTDLLDLYLKMIKDEL